MQFNHNQKYNKSLLLTHLAIVFFLSLFFILYFFNYIYIYIFLFILYLYITF